MSGFLSAGLFNTIPDGAIDYFQDNDISEYSVVGGSATTQDQIVKELDYALKLTVGSDSGQTGIASTSGLDNYPSQDDVVRAWMRTPDSDGDIYFHRSVPDETGGVKSGLPKGYQFGIDVNDQQIQLLKHSDSTQSLLATESVTLSTGTWYEIESKYASSDDQLSLELFDTNGNSIAGPITVIDSTFAADTGVGWGRVNGRGYFDAARIV